MTATFDNFIDGRWTSSRTGETFANENPASKGSNLGFFQSSSPDDIDEAIGAAAMRSAHGVPRRCPSARRMSRSSSDC